MNTESAQIASPSNRRSLLSIFFIKPTIQFKYVSVIFFAILLVSALMGIHFYYSVVKKVAVDLGYTSLYGFLLQLNIIMVCSFLSYAVIILVFAILISHKFAGPIFRFEQFCKNIADGDLSHRITLRRGDELYELKEQLNFMASNLQMHIAKDRETITAITQSLNNIARYIDESATLDTAMKHHLKETIARAVRDITSIHSHFKVH